METIKELGLELRPPRPRVDGVGRSIYFYDYDNHLLELHTGTLDERLARYGINFIKLLAFATTTKNSLAAQHS